MNRVQGRLAPPAGSHVGHQRAALLAGAQLLGSLMLGLQQPSLAAVALTPYEEGNQKMAMGPLNGSIRACPGNINPNCISTGSTNQLYSPVWRAPADMDAVRAAKALASAVEGLYPDAQLVQSAQLEGGDEYRAWTMDGVWGQDVLEILIKNEGVVDRGWEGDRPGPLVTYRSMASTVKYVYPFQQPLGDFDAQKKRLAAIRAYLGWSVLGCELIECF